MGKQVVTCGLVVEQRTDDQIRGEPVKFLTLADWTGMVETELFAQTYRSYGLATVRYPVLEITATVEPSENGRGSRAAGVQILVEAAGVESRQAIFEVVRDGDFSRTVIADG